MNGYIKLWRKFSEWQWIRDPNMVSMFIYLLLNASVDDYDIGDETIYRGELLTTLSELSKNTGMTISQVRTCLKKLEMTGEIAGRIAGRIAGKFRVVTVCNFESYQDRKSSASQAKSQAESQGKSQGKQEKEKSPNNNIINNINNNPLKEKEKYEKNKTPLSPCGEYGDSEVFEFSRFNEWLQKACPSVTRMRDQLTIKEYVNIRNEYGKELMFIACNRMENWTGLVKNCRSVNLTMRQRIRDELERHPEKYKKNEPQQIKY